MPLYAEGTRIEPPISVPMPSGEPHAETRDPSPPDDPPHTRFVSNGFFVLPWSWLLVSILWKCHLHFSLHIKSRFKFNLNITPCKVPEHWSTQTEWLQLFASTPQTLHPRRRGCPFEPKRRTYKSFL